MYLPTLNSPCENARRVTAVCRSREAESVQQQLIACLPHPTQADVLWLTWVQWRALGREAMSLETELSPWAIADRLRRLREAGIPILSWSEETDAIARGRFHTD
jgi:hypothetical protein